MFWPKPRPMPTRDPLAVFDTQVEREFPARFHQEDGLEFFRRGGRYCDFPEFAPYDQPYVLPLLERLSARFSFKWTVVAERHDLDSALSVYARIPDELNPRDIQSALSEEQANPNFKGDILQQWGHRYISLDFLTPEEVAAEMAEDALINR